MNNVPTPTATLKDVIQALGCKVADLKNLTPQDRLDLRRWLDEEQQADN